MGLLGRGRLGEVYRADDLKLDADPPIFSHFAAWYGSTIVAGLLMFIGLAAYAFYRCAAWKGGLADALVGE